MIEPRHVELLLASAIPLPLAERAGVRSLCGAETWEMGFGEKAGPALGFPYRDPATGVAVDGFIRLRLDNQNGAGRYRQPPGSRNHLYFPTATPNELRDFERPIIIAEGERKALALVAWCERQRRRDVVIGIGGATAWLRSIKGLQRDGGLGRIGSIPIEDLDAIAWTGRTVILALDSDVIGNRNVARAERALARKSG